MSLNKRERACNGNAISGCGLKNKEQNQLNGCLYSGGGGGFDARSTARGYTLSTPGTPRKPMKSSSEHTARNALYCLHSQHFLKITRGDLVFSDTGGIDFPQNVVSTVLLDLFGKENMNFQCVGKKRPLFRPKRYLKET